MTTIKEAQDRVDEFPHAKPWELDKDKVVVDATPDEIKALIEQAIREERKRCALLVNEYGERISELFTEMVATTHEDTKMMLAYDMHSRLIAVRHIINLINQE